MYLQRETTKHAGLCHGLLYYPMDESNAHVRQCSRELGLVRTNASLTEASAITESLAEKYDFNFIDVNTGLTDQMGNL